LSYVAKARAGIAPAAGHVSHTSWRKGETEKEFSITAEIQPALMHHGLAALIRIPEQPILASVAIFVGQSNNAVAKDVGISAVLDICCCCSDVSLMPL
jgi:hypothetical protein